MCGKEVGRTFSINLPIPVTVTDLPPKICVASSAISLPVRVIYLWKCEHRWAIVLGKLRTVSISRSRQPACRIVRRKTSVQRKLGSCSPHLGCGFTWFIWWVTDSIQFWEDSTREIIPANLALTTAWVCKGFPNAMR